jgi:hypothetical protein
MYIISKTNKGTEYLYSIKHAILCNSEQQAKALATFLNEHNSTTIHDFKLKHGEIWHWYYIDTYDIQPIYKIKTIKNKISIIKI